MARWGDVGDAFRKPEPEAPKPPLIQPSQFFATPRSQDELISWITKHNGGERTAAMVGAMMAWNLACSIINGTCENCQPFQELTIPDER